MSICDAERSAAVKGELLCEGHGKLLGRVAREGIYLWCRCGKHEVLVPWRALKLK